jgi:NAD(P)-dependent dehydrogenase (short-subunit alcohol dehydrogenase family)
VFFFECVHDVPRPIEALRNERAALRSGGSVIVMDERADVSLTAPADDVQRFLAMSSACGVCRRVSSDPRPRVGRHHAVGAWVVLASRGVEENIELARQLRGIPIACDVRLSADRERVVTAALDRHGRIDVLVNHAGIAHSVAAEAESLEPFRDQLETNTTVGFALTQLVARDLLERGSGSIVNVASVSSTTSLDRFPLAGYATSKAAVVGLTRELAAHWAGRGVRVNAISPAWFPSATSGWLRDEDQVAWISARAPIG